MSKVSKFNLYCGITYSTLAKFPELKSNPRSTLRKWFYRHKIISNCSAIILILETTVHAIPESLPVRT